jgi:exopolysaccharide biosynthesis polyprenyl glycosylphosphotransferase
MVAVDSRSLELLEDRRERSGQRRALTRRALLIADTSALVATCAAAILIWRSATPIADAGYLLAALAALPLWVAVASIYGLYGRGGELVYRPATDDLPGVFEAVTTTVWLIVATLVLVGIGAPPLGLAIGIWALAVAAVMAARATARARCRRRPAFRQNTIVLGAGGVGQHVARKIRRHPEYGLELIGFVDADPRPLAADVEDVPVLGGPDELRGIVAANHIERILVAFAADPPERTVESVWALGEMGVQVDVVPRLYELIGARVTVDALEALPTIGLPPVGPSRIDLALKRGFDVIVSAALLVLTAPLLLFIAWRVRRDSPGPVLFRQTRVGMGRRPFQALKFRTMRIDVDAEAHAAFIRQAMDRSVAPEADGVHKLDQSDAVTRSGRWLRKTSLDELPQLFNVLRGDMSLVGPRPCIPYEMEHFLPHHFDRFLVPAGVTGLWQVTARGSAPFGEALEMDVAYARGWSLGLDLRLLLRTPGQVLMRRGAR